jgi:hypothetical protein
MGIHKKSNIYRGTYLLAIQTSLDIFRHSNIFSVDCKHISNLGNLLVLSWQLRHFIVLPLSPKLALSISFSGACFGIDVL